MGMTVGPTNWWARSNLSANYFARICPLGTTLPDGSRIVCKEGGRSWIVAPSNTQVGQTWGNTDCCGCIDNSPAGVSEHPQITSTNWVTLNNCLITRGFTPSDWFVPNCSQMATFSLCRTFWDSFSGTNYWSSTENNSSTAPNVYVTSGGGGLNRDKTTLFCVRAFRCVTY